MDKWSLNSTAQLLNWTWSAVTDQPVAVSEKEEELRPHDIFLSCNICGAPEGALCKLLRTPFYRPVRLPHDDAPGGRIMTVGTFEWLKTGHLVHTSVWWISLNLPRPPWVSGQEHRIGPGWRSGRVHSHPPDSCHSLVLQDEVSRRISVFILFL